jgi:hypothetical protein
MDEPASPAYVELLALAIGRTVNVESHYSFVAEGVLSGAHALTTATRAAGR